MKLLVRSCTDRQSNLTIHFVIVMHTSRISVSPSILSIYLGPRWGHEFLFPLCPQPPLSLFDLDPLSYFVIQYAASAPHCPQKCHRRQIRSQHN